MVKTISNSQNILWFNSTSMKDLPQVGGKNASLGEMTKHLSKLGVQVPGGFATTADAFREFLSVNNLDKKINLELEQNNLNNYHTKKIELNNLDQLATTGNKIRQWILEQPFSEKLNQDITQAYNQLIKNNPAITVAVRSSATAEDLPNASFAGQQETFLNISGIQNLLLFVKKVYSSLYTDRAISYRNHHGFAHSEVAISVGIQQMVRSDLAASGVMFSIDTESGFDGAVFITSSYGLGEMVVQGAVNPDEFYIEKRALKNNQYPIIAKNIGEKAKKMIYADQNSIKTIQVVEVHKKEQIQFSLSNQEMIELAKQAVIIEQHYKRPMDIEWAKDGIDGKLYILQARPETVTSNRNKINLEKYVLKSIGKKIIVGRSVGQKIAHGKAKVVKSLDEITDIKSGDIIVTDMTDPDWEPVMKKAAAIVTNRGGRTCHAAIIARELGIPAVVGCNFATSKIKDGEEITVCCAEGEEGVVYQGVLDYACVKSDISKMPDLDVKIMLNIGNPTQAFTMQRIPNFGIGLARLEFVINQMIGIHPRACLEFDKLDKDVQNKILDKSSGYSSPTNFYIEKLAEGISTLACAFHPKTVIVRMSDFKSNEYANLIGGDQFEPKEENPMIGYRGAARYISKEFRESFALECKALKFAREQQGLTNIQIMIPFVRTVEEGKKVIEILDQYGLKRGENGLKIIMMCEIPSNAILAEEFLEHFDGFSIGSNDLTQLTLGVDRDSGLVANSFDEQNPAIYKLLEPVIKTCKRLDKYIGICGQGPSDHPAFAKWLLEQQIESISLTPDSVISTWLALCK